MLRKVNDIFMLWIKSNICKYREDNTSSTTINSKNNDIDLDNFLE